MQSKVISGYMDEQGRITQMPSKKKKKLYLLCYLADQIPENQEFIELFHNTVHTVNAKGYLIFVVPVGNERCCFLYSVIISPFTHSI